MKYFLDTEFKEDGKTIELWSIGIVCEDGREFYAETASAHYYKAMPWLVDPWLAKNVLPSIGTETPYTTREAIAADIAKFVLQDQNGNLHGQKVEFWGYYADYDWVVLCQQFGRMIDLPEGFPMFCMDLKQLCVMKGVPKLPQMESGEHNALADARWNRDMYDLLMRVSPDEEPEPRFLQVYDYRGQRLYDGENRRWCWKGVVGDIWQSEEDFLRANFPNATQAVAEHGTLAACARSQPTTEADQLLEDPKTSPETTHE